MNPTPTSPTHEGWLSRERVAALGLVIATAVVAYLCYRVIVPFLPAVAWALALTIVAHPLQQWINNRLKFPNLAAGLSVLIVSVAIVGPALFVTQRLARQATQASVAIQESLATGQWRRSLEKNARWNRMAVWVESNLGLLSNRATTGPEGPGPALPQTQPSPEDLSPRPAAVERAADLLTQGLGTVLTGSVSLLIQLFITAMTLFYFFRDRAAILGTIRSLLPLTPSEIDDVFVRIDDTIHATIYGSIVVALVQGGMGGLMFWWLGLPSPLLWGATMALLAVVPVLGTFVIWAPTAAFLAFSGEWTNAFILAAWGAIAIGLIDNFLYPFLVGKRLRFHTLLVFFSIVGGLALFGASGVILGPLLLALADALLHIWRRRTSFGGTLEQCSAASARSSISPADAGAAR